MKIDRKLSIIDIILGVIWLYTIVNLILMTTESNRKSMYIDWLSRDNHINIAKATMDYKSKNQMYPVFEGWRNILIDGYDYLYERDFKSFDPKTFIVCINANLKNIQNVERDTVLIFSGLNQNDIGNKDTLTNFVERYSNGWLVTVGGEYFYYDKRRSCFVDSDGKRKLLIDNVSFN